jgi:hypothetical protein
LGEQAKRPIDNNLGEQAKRPIDNNLGEQAKRPINKKSVLTKQAILEKRSFRLDAHYPRVILPSEVFAPVLVARSSNADLAISSASPTLMPSSKAAPKSRREKLLRPDPRHQHCPLCALDPRATQARMQLRLQHALTGGQDEADTFVEGLLENEPSCMYSCDECRRLLEARIENMDTEQVEQLAQRSGASLRARLMEAVNAGPSRFGPFASRTARLLELDEDSLDPIFARFDAEHGWQPCPRGGDTQDVPCGSFAVEARASLRRLAPSSAWTLPADGRETQALLLQGSAECRGEAQHAGVFVFHDGSDELKLLNTGKKPLLLVVLSLG